MKRIIASVGLVALGVASVKAIDYAPGYASTDLSRPWSVSATLRGFYDDNYLTLPDASKKSSFGVAISPAGSVAFSTDQTDVAARYTFTARYYDERTRRDEPWNYQHQFDGYLSHNFSHRFNVYVADSFVISSDPQVLDPLGSGIPYRTLQDNLRNTGSINFSAQLSPLLTLVLGYQNNYYDYKQDAGDALENYVDRFGQPLVDYPSVGDQYIPGGSYSALLDRVEHLILLNLQYQFSPQTVGVLGYQFGMIDYTGDDYLVPGFGYGGDGVAQVFTGSYGFDWNTFSLYPIYTPVYKSSIRNSHTHYAYAGIDHTFNPNFSVSIRAGAQYAEFYNQSPSFTQWGPYASVSARYLYGVGSYIEAGFSQQFNQTDVMANNASASIVYGTINHAFTPQLVGSVTGRFQHSEYNSQPVPGLPNYDGASDNLYSVGLNLAYHFDRHFSTEIGYNFDMLSAGSNTPRYDYTRNVVYVGVTARY